MATTDPFRRPPPSLRPGTRAYLLDGLQRAQGPLVFAYLDVTKECAADTAMPVEDFVARKLTAKLQHAAGDRPLGKIRLSRFDLDDEEEPPRHMLGFVAYATL